jgi:hypothetical protein
VLGGVDGSLHLTVPSMNRLNQTESATFSILPCWAFFRDSYFLLFLSQYNFRIEHRSGRKGTNIVSLSRMSCEPVECNCYYGKTIFENLPCKGCVTCMENMGLGQILRN